MKVVTRQEELDLYYQGAFTMKNYRALKWLTECGGCILEFDKWYYCMKNEKGYNNDFQAINGYRDYLLQMRCMSFKDFELIYLYDCERSLKVLFMRLLNRHCIEQIKEFISKYGIKRLFEVSINQTDSPLDLIA